MSHSAFATLHAFEKPLSPLSTVISRELALSRLPKHFPSILFFFATFQVTELWIAPLLLSRLSPTHFGGANARLKHNWSIRVVSMVHVLLVVPFAISCLNVPELARDKAFGYDEKVGDLIAIACAYFLWDTLESIVHFTDIGFVIHGFSCLFVYGLGFRPFLGYFAPRFLLWELSTPFLNIHWFLDKTDQSGSLFQIANGVILLITFFFARICYGGLMSLQFFYILNDVQSEIPATIAGAYALGNVILQGLNLFWFYKMIRSFHGRLDTRKHRKHLGVNGSAGPIKQMNGKMKTG